MHRHTHLPFIVCETFTLDPKVVIRVLPVSNVASGAGFCS